jgi:integrase
VWAKKIRGKLHYFGAWSDPDGALEEYNRQKDDLHAGRKPRTDPAALTIKELCNVFLNAKNERVSEGRLSPLTFGDYKTACDEIVAAFGKTRVVTDLRTDDFGTLRKRLARKWGLHRVCKTIQFVRSVSRYAYEGELIDRPVRFGPDFARPAAKDFRVHRAKQGPKLFTAAEVRQMIAGAGTAQLRAMIMLGINCGFGNSDCGNLPLSAINLDAGMIDCPRPKTGIARRCPLWPETVQALRDALAKRPTPKLPEHSGLLFVTRYGDSWNAGTTDGPLSRETTKLLRKLRINGRKGLGYYALRHTFRTVADGAKDQPVADHIMGHEVAHMSSVYREGIDDARLRAGADHVRAWLYPATA